MNTASRMNVGAAMGHGAATSRWRTSLGSRAGNATPRRRLFALALAVGLATGGAGADVLCDSTVGAIPDGSGSAIRQMEVPAPATPAVIASVRVSVTIAHPWVGDLRILLRHPSGAEVVLLDRPGIPSLGFPGPWGCGGDGLDVSFDDSAILPAESACEMAGTAIVGQKLSLQPLATFAGLSPQGTWVLEVIDDVAIDAGQLTAVCLDLTTVPAATCPADLDRSGAVDAADLALILGAWGTPCSGCATDLSGDGHVDGADLAFLLGAWGACS